MHFDEASRISVITIGLDILSR